MVWRGRDRISSNNSSSVFDFSLFWPFALNTAKDHRYKCPIDGMEYSPARTGYGLFKNPRSIMAQWPGGAGTGYVLFKNPRSIMAQWSGGAGTGYVLLKNPRSIMVQSSGGADTGYVLFKNPRSTLAQWSGGAGTGYVLLKPEVHNGSVVWRGRDRIWSV